MITDKYMASRSMWLPFSIGMLPELSFHSVYYTVKPRLACCRWLVIGHLRRCHIMIKISTIIILWFFTIDLYRVFWLILLNNHTLIGIYIFLHVNKEHLVSVHKYPANFRFNRPTRKQRKLTKDASEDNMEITGDMV